MRTRRLYTDQRLDAGMVVRFEPGPARHLVQVLRAAPGDPVALFNGNGRDWSAQVVSVNGPEGCTVRVLRGSPAAAESPLAVTLVQAVGKGEKMDWCFQKAVELGVAAIAPVLTERTEVKLDLQRAARRVERWRGIVLAVGPEGGFSPEESAWLKDQGFDGLCLGPRVLRTETAGPAALPILQARFGDLG